MAGSRDGSIRVFISYSRADKVHLKRLQVHLEPYVRAKLFEVWDDTHIQPGDRWREEIKHAIASATVAVFLVSADFFYSKFIATFELPPLLEAARNKGTRILPVIVGACNFSDMELGQLQAVNSPSRPLRRLKGYERDEVWVKVVNLINSSLPSTPLKTVPPQTPSATSSLLTQPREPALKNYMPPEQRTPALQLNIEVSQPRGATLHTYKGHDDEVWSVVWSPEGARLASGSLDGSVHIWDASTGQLLTNCEGHAQGVSSAVWSPDGTLLATGAADSTAQVWDAATGRHIGTYNHADTVYAVAWSPDGKYLALGGGDGIVQVWNPFTEQQLISFKGHTDIVYKVAWSLNGQYLALSSTDGFHFWDAKTGQHLVSYAFSKELLEKTWMPSGQYIGVVIGDHTLTVFDARTGERLLAYGGFSSLRATDWSPDGRLLAAGEGYTIQIWDTYKDLNQQIFVCKGHRNFVRAISWSPDGTRIASASDDHTVKVWSAG